MFLIVSLSRGLGQQFPAQCRAKASCVSLQHTLLFSWISPSEITTFSLTLRLNISRFKIKEKLGRTVQFYTGLMQHLLL